MADFIGDTIAQFDSALTTFYAGASAGISGYVMPLGWTVLALGLLVHAWAIMEGKVQAPLQDWMFKLVAALIVLYAMSGAYLEWVADPLNVLGNELSAAAVAGDSTSVLKALWKGSVEVLSMIANGISLAIDKWEFGTATLLLFFLLVVAGSLMLLVSAALFFVIYTKLGLSLVLAVGPFFLLGLLNQHTRSYFFSWLNTALYFVIYQVLVVIFMVLFLKIIETYMGAMMQDLTGQPAPPYDIPTGAAKLIGVGAAINLFSYFLPIVVISVAMFFMLLQLPTIASSMTSGSGGSFGNGLYAMSQMFRRGGKGNGGQENAPNTPLRNGGNQGRTPRTTLTLQAPKR